MYSVSTDSMVASLESVSLGKVLGEEQVGIEGAIEGREGVGKGGMRRVWAVGAEACGARRAPRLQCPFLRP
jgi:hypothetical protein